MTDLRRLPDGRILYHFYIEAPHLPVWESGEIGDLRLLPRRTLFTEKRDPYMSAADRGQTLSIPELNRYARSNGVEAEAARIWYGQGWPQTQEAGAPAGSKTRRGAVLI